MRERNATAQDIRTVIAARVSRRGFPLGSGAGIATTAAGGFVGSLYSGLPRRCGGGLGRCDAGGTGGL